MKSFSFYAGVIDSPSTYINHEEDGDISINVLVMVHVKKSSAHSKK